MSEMTHEQALAHFGVKGMRWGQHKAVSRVTTSTNSKRVPRTDAEKAALKRKVLLTAGALWIGQAAARVTLQRSLPYLQSAVANRQAAQGAKFAAEMFANSRGIHNFNALNLVFNAATGTWS